MAFHSIIVPSTRRDRNLAVCLASIEHSAEACGTDDYEVIVVGSLQESVLPFKFRYIHCDKTPQIALRPNEEPPYHKNAHLNVGVEYATGAVVTFLDADAVVGQHFMRNAATLFADKTLTKLAYRVRKAAYCQWPGQWRHWFKNYDNFPLSYEDADGNSQFSITREKLGDLRYDEAYYGRSYEDLSFLRTIREHYGKDYKCHLVTEGDWAMFHIKHDPSPGFSSDRFSRRNERLYNKETCVWAFCDTRQAAAALDDCGFTGRVRREADFMETLGEMIPGDRALFVKEVEHGPGANAAIGD